jgi:hypothetical protein
VTDISKCSEEDEETLNEQKEILRKGQGGGQLVWCFTATSLFLSSRIQKSVMRKDETPS